MEGARMKQTGVALVVAAAIGALAIIGIHLARQADPGAHPSPAAQRGASRQHVQSARGERGCPPACRHAGVALSSPALVPAFISHTGVKPGIVVTYQAFGAAFPYRWAGSMVSRRIIPLIQLNPRKVSLAAVAAGDYDRYLAAYGAQVARLGRPVALSFAHEANGPWYRWGCHHVPAATYIAAWRRVVRQIRDAGARNVIWVWTVNRTGGPDCPLAARYPGNRYVTWVGIDGYLRGRDSTFASVFGRTLAGIRAFTSRPVLLTEAGVPSGTGQASRILSLYRGARSNGLIGVVYFYAVTRKADYRPAGAAAVAAFRKGVRILLAG
jgi:mannan endo-1,4-beta-mannosidase